MTAPDKRFTKNSTGEINIKVFNNQPPNNTVEDGQANCTCKIDINFPCKYCIDKSHKQLPPAT